MSSELAYDRRELAAALGCSVDIVDDLTNAGRIPHVRLGPRKVVYSRKQIDEWLAAESDASVILWELERDGVHTGIDHQGAA